ncbi:MAG: hypothetical protein ACP5UV_00800 [Thermoplasmata archaeon]
MNEAQEVAFENSKPGTKFITVMNKLDEIYRKYYTLKYSVIGHTHSVELKP